MTKLKPKIYILPGWGDRITDSNYQKLIYIAKKNYNFIPLRIATRNRKYSLGSDKSLSEIIEKIEKQIIEPSENDTILGFSIGALQSYLLAQRLRFKRVILYSISSVLGEDLISYPKRETLRIFSPSQHKEIFKKKYSKMKNAVLLYGEKEPEILKKRSRWIGRFVEIRGADHVLDDVYINTLKKFL